KCYLCGNSEIEIIHKGTRDNPNIDVLECKKCGLVFLSSFDHIKDEVYEESEMHEEKKELDIEKYREQTKDDDIRRVESLKEIIRNKDILDFGCGNGGFIKYASNIANSINGVELEKKERDYLKAEGFNVRKGLTGLNNKFDVITLFHVLEHLKDPIYNLNYIKNFLNEDGEIIIEIPNANDALLRLYKSQKFADFTYWSFHLYLYNKQTLKSLAKKC
ncbi:class I SAM-dependent methyltransferase, partial [Clostridium neonatale]|uniref:class I SAM-dependent methyltransferase n=1 Tax=Clostridium neonatale TaxID=137838 RepID=UPI003D330C50